MTNVDTALICQLLKMLSDDLKRSRNAAHEFIDSLIKDLSKTLTQKKRDTILAQIKSAAKMIEYANFTKRQEAMWIEVWSEATRLLEKSREALNN